MKSIFISHVFEDEKYLNRLIKWGDKGLLKGHIITYESDDKRQLGKDVILERIEKKINGAAIVLVLIGNDTHNHGWIETEVKLANKYGKRICCVRVPDSTGGRPPIVKEYKLINFDPSSILHELN